MIRSIAVIVAVIAALALGAHAQEPGVGNPHLPPAQPAEPEMIRVDDMLLELAQFEAFTGLDQRRRPAHLLDFRTGFGPWDAGVIPYEIDGGFSEVQRQRILDHMAGWSRNVPLVFVERTTQTGYLAITRENDGTASPCYSSVGQFNRGQRLRLNLGLNCAGSDHVVGHEMGHAIGLNHEHQRADRDAYVSFDLDNVPENARFAFSKFALPLVGPYDFGSIMHYGQYDFAVDTRRPTIIPAPQYQSWASVIGTARAPSQTDQDVLTIMYNTTLAQPPAVPVLCSLPPVTSFQRQDLLLAMERLHAFYMSRLGLQRPQGLSINGRPDFLGIAQWIFEIYIPFRSAGICPGSALDYVKAAITRSDEWRVKNPGRTAMNPLPNVAASVRLDRVEYLDALNKLDRFYSAPEGLQRPQGLSIAGGPDFLGIATWIFDIYLNERLRGISPNAAWTITENAIKQTDEWRRKH